MISKEVEAIISSASVPGSEKKNRKKIYVCCPIRPKAKDPEMAIRELKKNLARAEWACRNIILSGDIPLCSPLYCIYGLNLDENIPKDRALGLEIGLDMLRCADEIHVFSDRISEGMEREINFASSLGIPVRMLRKDPSYLESIMHGLSDK